MTLSAGPGDTSAQVLDAGHQPTLRAALSTFATGVTAVCSLTAEGDPVGLTVSSFTSVSLEPPLLSFCVKRESRTWDHIRESGRFSVSVLTSDHDEICMRLARPGDDRFADIGWTPTPTGVPAIEGALSWFDCTIDAVHAAGDHDIVVGAVTALSVEHAPAAPLIFFRSELRGL